MKDTKEFKKFKADFKILSTADKYKLFIEFDSFFLNKEMFKEEDIISFKDNTIHLTNKTKANLLLCSSYLSETFFSYLLSANLSDSAKTKFKDEWSQVKMNLIKENKINTEEYLSTFKAFALGSRIRKIRTDKKIQISTVAKLLNQAEATLIRKERNGQLFTIQDIIKISTLGFESEISLVEIFQPIDSIKL